MARGLFLTFEGIDGSGKTAQARRLAERLRSEGREVVLTREPGGSPGAEDIRRLLVRGDAERWSAESEVLLFTAARRDHLEKTIKPALEAGKIVISDRFADSTRVYQGARRYGLRELADRLHEEYIALEPDLAIVLDMDPGEALSRKMAGAAGEDRFEKFGEDFQTTLREGFMNLARGDPGRFRVVDAGRGEAEVAEDVAASVRDALSRANEGNEDGARSSSGGAPEGEGLAAAADG